MRVEKVLGPTRDGGSCANCRAGYTGAPYQERRGRRVLGEVEPGVVEPVNLCSGCFEEAETDE